MKEERFPRTRKALRGRRLQVAVGKLRSHGGEHSHRGAEGKAERFPHRGSAPSSTHHPKRLVCSPAGVGGGWELRLGLRSDLGSQGEDWGWRSEHSLKGLVRHSCREGVREKVWSCRGDKRLFLASLFPGARGEIKSAA